MNTSNSFLILEQAWDQVIPWITRRLREAGLQVLPTFDLQVARSAHAGCSCPHHGTDQCDCQLAVLLIYEGQGEPVSLVIHGHDRKIHLSLVDTPEQRANPKLSGSIQDRLVPTDFQAANPESWSYAG